MAKTSLYAQVVLRGIHFIGYITNFWKPWQGLTTQSYVQVAPRHQPAGCSHLTRAQNDLATAAVMHTHRWQHRTWEGAQGDDANVHECRRRRGNPRHAAPASQDTEHHPGACSNRLHSYTYDHLTILQSEQTPLPTATTNNYYQLLLSLYY